MVQPDSKSKCNYIKCRKQCSSKNVKIINLHTLIHNQKYGLSLAKKANNNKK